MGDFQSQKQPTHSSWLQQVRALPSAIQAKLQSYLSSWTRSIMCNVLKNGPIPKHIAFIMDGNRRFARKNHREVLAGHVSGEKALMEVANAVSDTSRWYTRAIEASDYGMIQTLRACLELGVEEVSVFAFSIENYKRAADEVNGLMKIAAEKLRELLKHEEFRRRNRIRVFGDLSLLPEDVRQLAAEAAVVSRNNPGAVLNLCVSYTSTHEITSAIQAVVKGVEEGRLSPNEIDSYVLEKCLYTSECHEVDLLIRTSGEIRLSDFMLWQSSYSCMAFVDVLWPEFSYTNLYRTVLQFQSQYSDIQAIKQSTAGAITVPTHSNTPLGNRFVKDHALEVDRAFQALSGVQM